MPPRVASRAPTALLLDATTAPREHPGTSLFNPRGWRANTRGHLRQPRGLVMNTSGVRRPTSPVNRRTPQNLCAESHRVDLEHPGSPPANPRRLVLNTVGVSRPTSGVGARTPGDLPRQLRGLPHEHPRSSPRRGVGASTRRLSHDGGLGPSPFKVSNARKSSRSRDLTPHCRAPPLHGWRGGFSPPTGGKRLENRARAPLHPWRGAARKRGVRSRAP